MSIGKNFWLINYYTIFIIIFTILFSYIFGGEYVNYYKENKNLEESKLLLANELKKFSIENIKKLDNTEIFHTPDENVLEKIINKINKAKEYIYIEVYMLTEKRIIESLKKAKEKGLKIKIILEKNPYMAFNINNKSYNYLKKLNIEVVWSNPKNYSLNHSKLIIIDDEIIISTGNLTHSTFIYNRDFFIFTKDKNIVKQLNKIFTYDFEGKINYSFNNNLVLSPSSSRNKLEYLLNNAKKNINIYIPYIQDIRMENILLKKIKNGINISIIISENGYKNNEIKIKKLENEGIKIKIMKKHKMHSKAIMIDNNYLFIGSVNFSTYSIDKNREIGVLIKDNIIIEKFISIFNKDF